MDISVIIINFNSSQYTEGCLKSIIEKTSSALDYEIIVVDNDSEETDFNRLRDFCSSINFKHLKLYRNSINAGFGGGNMYGFKKAIGKFVAFINNDVVLINDCLSILKNKYQTLDKIGVCGPTTYTNNNKILPTLDFYASPLKFFCGRKIFRIFRPKLYHQRHKKLNEITLGDFVSGSFMFLDSEIFKSVGGFDENIFLYHEETDLCRRLNKINLFAALIPQAECFHYHGASTKKSIRIKTELKKSLLYVIRKHHRFLIYKLIQSFMVLKYFFKSRFSPKYKILLKHIKNPVKLNHSTKVTDE